MPNSGQHLSLENLLHVNYLEYEASKFTEHAPPFRRVCLLLAPPRQIVMTIAASSKKRRNSCSWFALEVLACSFPLMLCKRLSEDSQASARESPARSYLIAYDAQCHSAMLSQNMLRLRSVSMFWALGALASQANKHENELRIKRSYPTTRI